MTDRIHALTVEVALEDPIREDDLDEIMQAICMIRGVRAVTKKHVADLAYWSAYRRAVIYLKGKLLDIFKEE